MKEEYTGPERREYCAQHCIVADRANKSVPRWVYIGSLSTIIAVALIFAGWHVGSLRAFKSDIDTRLSEMELHLETRIVDMQERYRIDVARFYHAAEKNGVLLQNLTEKVNVINIRVGEIGTKQDLVVEKIGLAQPN